MSSLLLDLPYFTTSPRFNTQDTDPFPSDEILYNAHIHPEQYSNTLSPAQIRQLHKSIHYICSFAVDTLADSSKFPEEWLFKHRWGKGKKDSSTTLPNGSKFVFLTVGGRTSCVVPSVQKKTGPVKGDVKDERDGDGKADSEGKSKATSGKKALKSKKEEVDEDVSEPAAKGSTGKKDTAKKEKEPTKNSLVEDEDEHESTKPATKKRKPDLKTEAEPEPKKQKANVNANGVKAKPEIANTGRRRSGRVSGKAA